MNAIYREDIRFAHAQIHALLNRLAEYRGAGVFPDGTIDLVEEAAEAIDSAWDRVRVSEARSTEPGFGRDGGSHE